MKNSIISDLKITGLSHDGRGITSINGKTAFISGCLPDETVNAFITKVHSRYIEGKTDAITKPSPFRVEPKCPHFNQCGGCSLQHMSPSTQLNMKQTIVLEQLKHFGNLVPQQLLPPLSGEPWGYRRKARLGVKYVIKKQKLLVGFREKDSRYLADIQQCPILDARIGQHLEALAVVIRSLSVFDQIPQVEVAASDTMMALVIRHMQPLTESDKSSLMNFAKEFNFHIYLQPNKPEPITKLWPSIDSHFDLTYQLKSFDLSINFNPLNFTQVNAEMNQSLVDQALSLLQLSKDDIVLDLFCGLGNFTLPMAKLAHHVIGIEGSEEMVDRAKQNAILNNLKNTEFYAANLMDENLDTPWMTKSFNKILLDPPRSGAKEILPKIANKDAKTIVYVSCNPATFARDAKELVYTYHYKLKALGIVNMFPHTSHIEVMALFEK